MRTPLQLALPEIQQGFREIWASLDPFLRSNPDLGGRKFTNVGKAVSEREWVTLGQADGRYVRLAEGSEESGIKPVRIDTFALRGPAWKFRYNLFEASDRNYVAWVSDGKNWIYAYGIHSRTQSQLSALATDLGTNDAGYLVFVTDFGHLLRWSGSAWQFGPGESGGGYIQGFVASPEGPGTYWQICDGTASSYLKADGTTASFTTPNLTGHYLKFNKAGYTGTATAGGITADESAHTHAVGTPTGGNNTNTLVDNTGAGSTVFVAATNHTHAVTTPTSAGSAHNHGPGTLDLARTELIPYFRR